MVEQDDDLNSFEVGKQDDSALALTLSTTTQNRICWLMAQSSRLLLGTADAEWAVSGGQGVMTYAKRAGGQPRVCGVFRCAGPDGDR